jgi:hypothetical protein
MYLGEGIIQPIPESKLCKWVRWNGKHSHNERSRRENANNFGKYNIGTVIFRLYTQTNSNKTTAHKYWTLIYNLFFHGGMQYEFHN